MDQPEPKPKDCCPQCGHHFAEVADVNQCPVCKLASKRDELIDEDSDYTWVM